MGEPRHLLNWLLYSDGGFLTRVAIGVAIFLILALVDIRRNRSRATRWREYTFLLAVIAMAMLYGALNDLITSRISYEYFLFGKSLAQTLGYTIPPDPAALARGAVMIGIKATWSVGLIIGVAMLIANNPSKKLGQLPYRRLINYAGYVLLCSAVCAVMLGFAGSQGWLVRLSPDFGEMTRNNEFRPYRFMAVYGIHLGGYIGGVIGTIIAIISIRLNRKRK
jgi:multisubunit Na+/H+ antiporter MnhB subunit